WLFNRTTDHIVVWTNLLAWIHYTVNRFDIVLMARTNFVVFGGMLLLLGAIAAKVSRRAGIGLPFFLLFFLSAQTWEIHARVINIHCHLQILFSHLCLFFLFGVREQSRGWIAAIVFGLATLYADGAGPAVLLAILGCYVGY